jgi:hypothetical protein
MVGYLKFRLPTLNQKLLKDQDHFQNVGDLYYESIFFEIAHLWLDNNDDYPSPKKMNKQILSE